MQLNDTLTSLMRRWYFVLFGLAITCGLGWLAYTSVTPRYESVGSVLLMPSAATVGDDGNPYLYLGGMNDALDILIRRTNAADVQDEVLSEYDSASYVVEKDANTQSPIVVVTVDAATNTDSLAVLQDALASIDSNMSEMQDELAIPQERRITLRDLVIDDEATKDTKTAIQLAIVAFGAGSVGTLLLVGLVDGYIIRRNEHRSGRRDASKPAPSPEVSDSSPHSRDGAPVMESKDNSDTDAESPIMTDSSPLDSERRPKADDADGTHEARASQPAEALHGVLESQRR